MSVPHRAIDGVHVSTNQEKTKMPTRTRIELDSCSVPDSMPADERAVAQLVADELSRAMPDHPEPEEIDRRLAEGQKVFAGNWDGRLTLLLGPVSGVRALALELVSIPVARVNAARLQAMPRETA